MPTFIVKPDRDADMYVAWSTIVEGPTWLGTRDEALDYGIGAERLTRADDTGTSALDISVGAWDDAGFIALDPLPEFRWLPRANLAAYTQAIAKGCVDDAYALTEPLK